MIWLWIVIVVAILIDLVFLVGMWVEEGPAFAIFGGLWLPIVSAIVAIPVYLIGGVVISAFVGQKSTLTTHQDHLVAVTDRGGESSPQAVSALLYVGGTSDKPAYTFYASDERGGARLYKVSTDHPRNDVRVFQDATPENSYVVWTTTVRQSAHPLIVFDVVEGGLGPTTSSIGLTEIHVPPNSIRSTIDLGVGK